MTHSIYKDQSFKKKFSDLTDSEKQLADKEINKFVSKLAQDRDLSDDFRQEIARRILSQPSRKKNADECTDFERLFSGF